MRTWAVGLAIVGALASAAVAQQGGRVTYPVGGGYQGYRYGQKPSAELTIEEQRKLGLSDEQIQKIAVARREVEVQREQIQKELDAARAAASAANAEVARLNGDLRTVLTVRIRKIYESVMTPDQLKAWKKQQFVDQAKQYLRSYMRWLKLTEERRGRALEGQRLPGPLQGAPRGHAPRAHARPAREVRPLRPPLR